METALKPRVAILLAAALLPSPAGAQPAPSFRASCGELRGAIEKLGWKEGELVTIEVVGTLTLVRHDGALAYLAMCRPPDPQVLCVSYETNGRKVGESAVLTGAYIPRGPNHIQLDPCLHHGPEE
jgi:hypothetical protein